MYVGNALVRRIPVRLAVGEVIGNQLNYILQHKAPNAKSCQGNKPEQIQGIGRHKRFAKSVDSHVGQNCREHAARLGKEQPQRGLEDFLWLMKSKLPYHIKQGKHLLSSARLPSHSE